MKSRIWLVAVAFCILQSAFCISAARGADIWTLTTGDLSTRPVVLKSLDASGVVVSASDGTNQRTVPMDQFVELARPTAAAPGGKFTLYLTSGDHVAGEPDGVKGESLVWKNAIAGEIRIPLRQIKAMAKPDVKPLDERRKEDVVTLSNKDTARGTIADLTPEKVTLQTDAGPTDLPLSSIESISFAASAPSGSGEHVAFRVRLDDGSGIIASGVKVNGDHLDVTTGSGSDAAQHAIDVAHVAAIEQLNGPVSWLSSRTPTENVYTPFLGTDQQFLARMHTNVLGEPIRFGERVYRQGIGVHSYSRLVFPLDGKTYTTFRTRYAFDPSTDVRSADATVRIKLDGKVAYEKQHVTVGVLSPVVVLDLGNARTLTLEVDYGRTLGFGDKINWIEPALLKVKPAAEPQPPAPEPSSPTTAPTTAPATTPTTNPAAAAANAQPPANAPSAAPAQ